MKTFRFACDQARRKGIAPCEQWMMVTAILMSKLAIDKQSEFSHERKSNYYGYRIPDLLKFHQN